jgi:hypothetical protein
VFSVDEYYSSLLHSSQSASELAGYRSRREGKRPLGNPTCTWIDSIKIDLREIKWDDMDWNDLAQDRDKWRFLLNMVINFRGFKNEGCVFLTLVRAAAI